jgi:hypothetical protein
MKYTHMDCQIEHGEEFTENLANDQSPKGMDARITSIFDLDWLSMAPKKKTEKTSGPDRMSPSSATRLINVSEWDYVADEYLQRMVHGGNEEESSNMSTASPLSVFELSSVRNSERFIICITTLTKKPGSHSLLRCRLTTKHVSLQGQ